MVMILETTRGEYRCRTKVVKDRFLWQDWFKGKWGKYEDGKIEEKNMGIVARAVCYDVYYVLPPVN